MVTPASSPNPVRDTQDLQNKKVIEDHQHLHDAGLIPAQEMFDKDIEKGAQGSAKSLHNEERTLEGEVLVKEQEPDLDPDIVDWDGPNDPQNPQNWTNGKKWQIIAALGFITLITPLASSFFAPGVPQVLTTFNETSNLIASFVVSVYILGFAIGPLIIAPLSELYGRQLLYNICNVLFMIFNIACALSKSTGMLIAFRLLAGCAGSAPLTLGGGTIADMFPLQERARAMAIYAIGPLLGPVIGPVCGGFLVQAVSWRWVFWILAISGGISGALFYIVGRETYAPTLLERKAVRLRKATGNLALRSKLASGLPPKEIFTRAIARPMKMLFLSPIVGLMALYIAVNYGVLYLFFTTMTFVFKGTYQFSTGAIGLSFIGLGVGMMIGMAMTGVMSDKIIKRYQAMGVIVKPEHRLMLTLTVPGAISMPIGIFLYGWTTYYHVHWIVPIIGTAFVGFGNITALMTIQTYLVDAFTIHAASVMAANTVLRSLFGAFIPLFGLDMYDALGLGWGNSLLGFIALAFIPVPVLFFYYGERIRMNPRFRVSF